MRKNGQSREAYLMLKDRLIETDTKKQDAIDLLKQKIQEEQTFIKIALDEQTNLQLNIILNRGLENEDADTTLKRVFNENGEETKALQAAVDKINDAEMRKYFLNTLLYSDPQTDLSKATHHIKKKLGILNTSPKSLILLGPALTVTLPSQILRLILPNAQPRLPAHIFLECFISLAIPTTMLILTTTTINICTDYSLDPKKTLIGLLTLFLILTLITTPFIPAL